MPSFFMSWMILFLSSGLFCLAEDCIHLGMVCESVGALSPRLAIHGAGAPEQIFNVI
jgi:hypothetical protein